MAEVRGLAGCGGSAGAGRVAAGPARVAGPGQAGGCGLEGSGRGTVGPREGDLHAVGHDQVAACARESGDLGGAVRPVDRTLAGVGLRGFVLTPCLAAAGCGGKAGGARAPGPAPAGGALTNRVWATGPARTGGVRSVGCVLQTACCRTAGRRTAGRRTVPGPEVCLGLAFWGSQARRAQACGFRATRHARAGIPAAGLRSASRGQAARRAGAHRPCLVGVVRQTVSVRAGCAPATGQALLSRRHRRGSNRAQLAGPAEMKAEPWEGERSRGSGVGVLFQIGDRYGRSCECERPGRAFDPRYLV